MGAPAFDAADRHGYLPDFGYNTEENMQEKQRGNALAGLLGLAFTLSLVAAWLTHLYVCFNTGRWGFLIAGAIFFPVAIIHGIGIWFGFWP